jgi:putative two-component system response regulator
VDTRSLTDSTILVAAGDAPTAREIASMLEDEGYSDVHRTGEIRETLYRATQGHPDLVVLDMDAAGGDAPGVLGELRDEEELDPAPAVVGVTAEQEESKRREMLELGLDGLVRKPLDRVDLALEVRSRLMIRALSGAPAAEGAAAAGATARDATDLEDVPDRELERAQIGVLQTLARLVEYRDFKTERHAERVGDLSARIARKLGLSDEEVESIRDAAPLHDVGMVVVPDHILLKEGDLSPDERKIMMTHAANGARILSESELPVMQLASEIARTHHERWDGGGYPRGLEGEEIPLSGRIVAVADTFEAITHDRPFREAESAERALEEIRRERGKQFDPRVVDALLEVKEEEPHPAGR